MSFHTLILVGRLGRDPEMRYTNTGQAVTSFSVATDYQFTDASGQVKKETTWFAITVWGKQAESCNNFLQKGRMVLVEGRLKADPETGGPRTFTKNDGTTGAKFEVTARTVRFLSSKAEGQVQAGEEPQEIAGGDDLPF